MPKLGTARKVLNLNTPSHLTHIFSNESTTVTMKVCLNNNKKTDFCAPLTSFDWNVEDPRLIATSSIDTTCSIWDISAEKVSKTSLFPCYLLSQGWILALSQ